MVSTELVGRESELAALGECLAEALRGRPRLVLCQGEPGIGKSRLAEETVGLAAASGALGVWGLADDSSGSPPYWPWLQVLRAVSRAVDLVAIAAEDGLAGELARVVPDVFPGERPRQASASAEDRFRQFDAVAQLLRRVCLERPLVIVFDDAHWASEPSLLLVQHVARGLTDERLLIVVNARDSGHRSGEMLARLVREPLAAQIHLRGLGDAGIRRQLETITGHPADDADVAEVQALTGGNPFFVGEVARAIADRGGGHRVNPVTPSVRSAIAGRLDRLSPQCIGVARAAAVAGREFAVPVVATMVRRPALRCLALLDEAERAGLIEAASAPDEYRFVHVLVRDAIEAGLDKPERVLLHRRAAEAIEERYAGQPGPQLFELARHWAEAAVLGDAARAALWVERAGDEAMRQLAYEEAARLFRQALRVGGNDLSDDDRCRLLLAAGSAMNLCGDIGGRLDACLEAAVVARRLGRPDLVAESALVMEPVGAAGFDIATRRLCQEALAGLGPGSPALRARTAARFAETFVYLAEVDAAREASQQALEIAEQCGDAHALAAAFRARQVVLAGPEGLDDRARLAERMLALSRESGEPNIEKWARLWQIDVSFERGDLAAVASGIDALARCAQQVGGPFAQFQVLHSRAALAQAQARYPEARRLADEAVTVMGPADHPGRFYPRAAVLGFVGRHLGQDTATLAATSHSNDPEGTAEHAGLISVIANAQALVSAGRLDSAGDVYRSLGPVAGWQPPPHVVLLSYSIGIDVAVALEAGGDVALLRDLLTPYRGHHVVSGIGAMSYFGPVELWLGVAARHLGRLDDAVTDLERADRACAAAGAPGFRVEAQYERAAALAGRAGPGDLELARSLLDTAGNTARSLGMTPFATRITELAHHLGHLAEPGPLTRREREVAELVAQGLTNREIAGRLFLSERTADNHVQHILAKLGVPNRSQVAVWVTNRK